MGRELLFEIGTEEIPSGYIPGALQDMRAVATRLLQEARLGFRAVRTFATPRRLTLLVEDLAETQADARREVVGPTRAVAFDAEGKPTRAAEGFARAQGVPVDRLEVRALDRGEVFLVTRNGVPVSELRPAPRRAFVPAAEVSAAFDLAPTIDRRRLRRDLGALAD